MTMTLTQNASQPKILVIDDEIGPRESLRILLKNEYEVLLAESVDLGVELLRDAEPDLVIMDIRMPGKSGIEGLQEIEAVTLYGPLGSVRHGGALSLNIKNLDPSMLGFRLDREYGICCRTGLHCAPEAHGSIGTLPEGTVRLSPGFFNTLEDIATTLEAVRAIIATET